MKIRIIAQIIADVPDEKYGYLDPFSITITKLQQLIKSGKPRKLLKVIPNRENPKEKGSRIMASITAERLEDE